jgi:hypothetical protein
MGGDRGERRDDHKLGPLAPALLLRGLLFNDVGKAGGGKAKAEPGLVWIEAEEEKEGGLATADKGGESGTEGAGGRSFAETAEGGGLGGALMEGDEAFEVGFEGGREDRALANDGGG